MTSPYASILRGAGSSALIPSLGGRVYRFTPLSGGNMPAEPLPPAL